MTQLVFENEYVICELDDALPVLKHRWKIEPPGETFRANLITIQERYIELAKSYANLAWLADTQLLGEVDQETEEWFSNVWEDLLFVKAGVKYHGVILGDDFFAEYPMEKFKLNAEEKFATHGVQLAVFSDEEEAYEWIRTR
ncbi:MAG: hypothetical protein KF846_00200 [Cyclobacteriaceae bacterium]|nr:hypothetical protein [Cyclobacteriaceae bacterium]MBX2954541.1 hypothetical protein [Cyclobacteriaceae bacterium]